MHRSVSIYAPETKLIYNSRRLLDIRGHMQVVDDEQQHTLVAASTLMPEIRGQLNGTGGANKVCILISLFQQL